MHREHAVTDGAYGAQAVPEVPRKRKGKSNPSCPQKGGPKKGGVLRVGALALYDKRAAYPDPPPPP